jgi:rare lipoprotein A
MISTNAHWPLPRLQALVLFALLTFLSTACGHKQTQVSVPPPPPIAEPSANLPTTAQPETKPKGGEGDDENEALKIPINSKPLAIETGLASWYGAPYHNRRGSNGEVYNMHAMTAAHLTLPLGSVVRVTNIKTGSSAIVRITDRGPFVEGRIIDLSLAAAKKLDVWKAGVATVRLEVLEAPAPLDSGGRWAVQIGPFEKEGPARKLEQHLSRRYQSAKVLSFDSPTGDWWVRVRVQQDDRKRANEVAKNTETVQGAIFLVRLD